MEGENLERKKYSKRKQALFLLWGDAFHEFDINISRPESEDGWKLIFPSQTIEERYSDHSRFSPEMLPRLLEGAPDEVKKVNEFVHKINIAINHRDYEAMEKVRQEALEFRESLIKKWEEID